MGYQATEDRPIMDQVAEESEAMFESMGNPYVSQAGISEHSYSEDKSSLSEIFKSIHEGTHILVDSREKEAMLSREMCTSLVSYTKWLGTSLELTPKSIPEFNSAKRIYLSPEGKLMITEEDKVRSKPLEAYSPETVMAVVLEVLPQLGSVINSRVQKLNERISLFNKISQELSDLPTDEEEPEEKPFHEQSLI